MALVVDTGPLVAGMDARDPNHDACKSLLADALEPLVVPAPVLVELEFMLRRVRPAGAFTTVLEEVRRGAYRVVDMLDGDYVRISELLSAYADLQVGFVDAAVLAVVERLGEPKLATLDHRHFAVMRPRHVDTLELLPA